MPKKFLCDQMCAELGKWLRAAGYDTAIINTPLRDPEVFQKAKTEGRLLLTRDKYFKELDPEGKIVLFLRQEFLDNWARQLTEEQIINWLYRPFSRCLQCNTPLEKTIPSDDVPDLVQERSIEFWLCPHCNQLFWLGSHTEHMLETLKKWSSFDQ